MLSGKVRKKSMYERATMIKLQKSNPSESDSLLSLKKNKKINKMNIYLKYLIKINSIIRL